MPRFSIAAVALLVTAVGVSAWIAGNRGGIGSVPPATPTVTPTQAAQPTPRVLTGLDQSFELSAGTYRAGSPFSVPLTVTVPDRWGVARLEENIFSLYHLDGDEFVTIVRPKQVRIDPCYPDYGLTSAGSTVDEVEAALKALPDFVAVDKDVSIDGSPVTSFILNWSTDAWGNQCQMDDFELVTYDRFGQDEPVMTPRKSHNHIYLVEIDGQPVLIDGQFPDWVNPGVQQLDTIVRSIDFD